MAKKTLAPIGPRAQITVIMPADLCESLKLLAISESRSLNSQAVHIIRQAILAEKNKINSTAA